MQLHDSLIEPLGVSRLTAPLPFAPEAEPVNFYLADDSQGVALIDTGLIPDDGLDRLVHELRRRGYGLSNITRVIVTHGHLDHFGLARRIQDAAGCPVLVSPGDLPKLGATEHDVRRSVEMYSQYLPRMGCHADAVEDMRQFYHAMNALGEAVGDLTPLRDGEILQFRRFSVEVIPCPGHTSGLVCLYDREHGVLFSNDHLLLDSSPNPFVELDTESGEKRFRSLPEYLRSLDRVEQLDARITAPGHGPLFRDHRRVIALLRRFHQRRQFKIMSALDGLGCADAQTIARAAFSPTTPFGNFMLLSEVIGGLELLEQDGRVRRGLHNGREVYESCPDNARIAAARHTNVA
ncbi:MAG: Hydroxyacylglutathione hydrolase [Myxococcota bacterium]|nr:Hydroxyacylglutathione hydrolase [Myxococcota bacterium]